MVWLSWFSDLGFTRPKSTCWPGVFFSRGSRDESFQAHWYNRKCSVLPGFRTEVTFPCWLVAGAPSSRGCSVPWCVAPPFSIFNVSGGGVCAVYASVHPDLPFCPFSFFPLLLISLLSLAGEISLLYRVPVMICTPRPPGKVQVTSLSSGS